MNQILEIVFRKEAKIGDLKYLFKLFIIIIILCILNPEVWLVLVGVILYFIFLHISS